MRKRKNGHHSPVVYDRLAAHYDCAMRPLEGWLLARLRAKVFRELPTDGRILEVGAGTGANFAYYSDEARGVASELSREMLKRAREKKRPMRVHLACNNAEQLPFADASFDAAFATLVFCSVASPQQAFAELRRVVRPEGRVVLLEHVRPEGLLGSLFDVLSLVTVPLFDDHFNRQTAREAVRAGLEVERIDKHLGGIVQLIVCRV
ncbi:MAG: methyltransferase domain-containing protein [Pyrinomonadaceae bacterium]|nr:methyltransferase domain-containing protein [Pyrinomonadaceae bacterium]